MNKYVYNLQIAFITALALFSSLHAKVAEYEFEVVFISGCIISVFILIFDILTIIRCVYIVINRKKRFNVIDEGKRRRVSKKVIYKIKLKY